MEALAVFIYNRTEDISDIWYALKERIIWILKPHNEEVEYLRRLIESERQDRKELIDLMRLTNIEEDTAPPNFEPINTFKPFRVIRSLLERADRQKAKELKITDEAIEEVEKSLGVK